MAKQRNSLGLFVLPVPYGTLSWEDYKKEYGIDLDTIFVMEGTLARVRSDFSKILAIDWHTFYKRAEFVTTADPLILIPTQYNFSGDLGDKFTMGTTDATLTIDVANRTIQGEEI